MIKNNNKILSLCLFIALLFSTCSSIAEAKTFTNTGNVEIEHGEAQTYETSSLNVFVDGNEVNFGESEPIVSQGRSLVPLRPILEGLGVNVSWNKEQQAVFAQKNDTLIKLPINSSIAYVNSQEVSLGQEAIKGTTYIPLRFITTSFGASLSWDNTTKTIYITSKRNQFNPEIKDMKIIVQGKQLELDSCPIMKNGRTLVPVREIFEAMGATVDWNPEEQTCYATRKGKSVKLIIGSDIAWINDQEALLDEPATLYGGRTLVPLRFIGEAFDGVVDWDKEVMTVTISLAQEKIIEILDRKVFLNNKELNFDVSISKDGRNYIPLGTIFDGLENKVDWDKEGDEISVAIDGASMKLFVNKNYAIVNGEQVHTTDFPIEYEGIVLAPIRFVTEAFGGIPHFDPDTKETYIIINRPKFKTSFLEKEPAQIVKPVHVPSAALVGNRRLMVCDNPEILNDNTIPVNNVTLWNDIVHENKDSIDHRVFGWHINNLDKKVNIGITIENLSKTNDIELVDLKGIYRRSTNGWSNYDVGLPIAETVLSQKLMNVKMPNTIVKAGETMIIDSFELEQDNIIGFLNDFTVKKVSGTGKLNYKIRTVLSQSDRDLADIKSNPVLLDKKNSHPRGVWESSELFAELPTYQVGSKEVSYSLSNGVTDNLMNEASSLDSENSIENKGHYGATYKIKIPVINNTGKSKIVRIRIGGRGGLYAGAVKTKEGVFITPILEEMKEVANVIDYEVKGNKDIIELEIMHAGGSALAMAVDMLTVE